MGATDSAFDRLNADTLAAFGESARYTPSGGAPTDIIALVNIGEDLDDVRPGARQSVATISVLVSDIASPGYQDQVEADGVAWTVVRSLGKSAGMWKLEAVRDLRSMHGVR